jgi:outer membrane receptor protein involved in Fe transport
MKLKLIMLSMVFCGVTYAQDKPKKTDSEQTQSLDEVVVAVASATFYDGLENMKEVQMNTSSLSFKSINTRGFATVANTRFMQLVDGMDNSSPLLNFVLGNLIGVSEIDVQSVELLPGASSALYGANAFNGILFMTSQSPFDKQGITAYAKYGNTNQKAAGSNNFYDYGIRAAHTFSPYFAAKANFSFLNGTDWFATNYDDKTVAGRDRSHFAYNGINVYGDEAATNINAVADGLLAVGAITAAQYPVFKAILPNETVSRTGYNETDLTESKVRNTKIDFSLHARPFGKDTFEVIWQSKFGYGNSIYQGANRYNLNNFFMQQHKIEFKGKNFFVRGYTTTEDGGKSYDMTFAALNVNRAWKPDATWFGQYAGAYVTASLPSGGGLTGTAAHNFARNVADAGRLIPGTDAFKNAFNKVIAEPNVLSGAKLVDNSRIYHSDANYNFKDLFTPAEIQVGGSYREYQLNSGGRIYTDANGPIYYNEYGVYTQVQKKLMDEKLKLTGSVRYDKAKNFDGNFSPRVSLVYAIDAKKQNVFRASYQTGFRNPSTQDQYIGFNVGSAVLLGSAADNLTRFQETLPIASAAGQAIVGGLSTQLTGTQAYYNSYTAASVTAFAASGNPALLKKATIGLVKPETVKAIDLGYRSSIAGFSLDINGYYNTYNDFLGNANVITPLYGVAVDAPNAPTPVTGANLFGPTADTGAQTVQAIAAGNRRTFQLYTNTNIEIKSLGAGIGLTKKVYGDFELGANYNYAQFDFDQSQDKDFEAGFNTPKHKVKVSLSNAKLLPNLGFNVSGRWNTAYLWQSTFADGMIAEATVVDAQINYGIKSLKSILKIGATNIGGKEYGQVLGAGLIGQQYFASWTITP